METQRRGQLTKRVQEKAQELLGYKIQKCELRLLPYIQYVMVNNQKIEPSKIKEEEKKILKKWKNMKYITGGAAKLNITKEFWDITNEILFDAYVNIDN